MNAAIRAIEEEKNERSMAILLGALVEAALGHALIWTLDIDDSDLYARAFESDGGPLSDFNGKILMAAALRLTGPISTADLHVIRHVRNAFAHSVTDVTFSTTEVAATCDRIKLPKAFETDRPIFKFGTAREKYAFTCEWLFSSFLRGGVLLMTTRDRNNPQKRLRAVCPEWSGPHFDRTPGATVRA
jgi:hypothetical protein